MKVKFWGVRGSYPVPGVTTNLYGGNTSCIEVRFDDHTAMILDAGTGIRPLGNALMQNGFSKGQGSANILITHTHWDHIQGFPFFKPAFVEGNRFTVYARRNNQQRLKTILEYQNNSEYFPVPFSAMKASFDFVEIEADETYRIGPAIVKTIRLNHPNIALGYRIEADGKVFAYITDTSPFESILIGEHFIPKPPDKISDEDQAALNELQRKLLTVIENADLMVYDTFFRLEEYQRSPHWGHSTPEHGLDLCREAGVKAMALFHHAPSNSDEVMGLMDTYYQKLAKPDRVEVFAAREGKEILL